MFVWLFVSLSDSDTKREVVDPASSQCDLVVDSSASSRIAVITENPFDQISHPRNNHRFTTHKCARQIWNRIERTSWNTRLFNRLPIWRWWNWPPALLDLHRHRSPTGHPKSNSMVTNNFFFFFYVRVHIFHVLASCGQKKLCASPSGGFLFLFSGLRRVTSIEIDLQRWVASCIKLFSLTHQPKKIWIFRFLLLSGNFKCFKKKRNSFIYFFKTLPIWAALDTYDLVTRPI